MADHEPDLEGGPALRTIAMPADTNPNGDIFGGWLLAQMDVAGGMVAARRAQGRVATVGHRGDEVPPARPDRGRGELLLHDPADRPDLPVDQGGHLGPARHGEGRPSR